MTDIASLVEKLTDEISARFVARIRYWTPDLNILEAQNVIGGLLARICSLAIEFALSPYYWNAMCSQIILRSMVEAVINLGWIALEPVERAKLFVDYGLGQDKLDYEHLKAGNKTYSVSEETLNRIADGLAAQRHLIFTDVNVGTWSNISVAKMAAEAELASYALLFAGFCGTVHSNWLLLHDRFIRLSEDDTPQIPKSMPVNLGYLLMLATFVDQALEIYDAVCDYPETEEENLIDYFAHSLPFF